MKRLRMILMLCCVCIVLIFTLVMCKYCAKDHASELADPETVSIDTMAEDVIQSIHWDSVISGNHTLKKDRASQWLLAEDETFPVRQYWVSKMITDITGLESQYTIYDDIAISDYGFGDPLLFVTLEDTNGKMMTLKVGDYNEFSGYYYAQIEGTPNVYMIDDSLIKRYCVNIFDELLQKEEIAPILADNVRKITMHFNNDTDVITYTHSEEVMGENEWYLSGKSGGQIQLEPASVEAITRAIENLRWSSCVEYNASQQNLSQYGLDEPIIVEISYEYERKADTGTVNDMGVPILKSTFYEDTFILWIGNDMDGQDGLTYCYAMLPNGTIVYTIPPLLKNYLAIVF